LDLHHVFRIALGGFALAAAVVTAHRFFAGRVPSAAALFAAAAIALALLPPWNPGRLSSGLFRVSEPQPWTYRGPGAAPPVPLVSYEDDPSASVGVYRDSGKRTGANPGEIVSLIVNGKPDGSTEGDLQTMAMAAILPALFAAHTERAFVIGYGTGISAGYLA